jgi:hypothetical protein
VSRASEFSVGVGLVAGMAIGAVLSTMIGVAVQPKVYVQVPPTECQGVLEVKGERWTFCKMHPGWIREPEPLTARVRNSNEGRAK